MESINNSADSEVKTAVPLSPDVCVPPILRDRDHYHVFVSYSNTDYHWTHCLIHQLESCGLKVCYHERDFIPGRTVLENMSDCIEESQKVLLVLSPEFVRSRWCLLEANMSLFRDCLERKPIVPLMLEPGVTVPLHLCHLTYLDAKDPDFMSKLLKVLCTPNQHLHGSTVVPFQPPTIYNGKALQPLTAVNDEELNTWDSGHFSEMELPDQLRLIIEDQEQFRTAVRMINDVSKSKVWLRPLWVRVLTYFFFILLFAGFIPLFVCIFLFYTPYIITGQFGYLIVSVITFSSVPLGLLIHIVLWMRNDKKDIVREMQKTVGQANTILSEEKVLMGCQSNSKLYLVYVALDGCRKEFAETFPGQSCAEEMFQRALVFFSSGYACCLSKRHFPFPQSSSPGHMDRGVCFCQYVSEQLSRGEWE
ncbi:uncharacterized protein LOC117515454 [Thalassophryne amazonica]|uniref:uncharacterized protein LOC117515454 n=1 Tax=Thalassophryne amazonica TaxID=390379 RepID=UPI0014719AC9|nr:uncharacterized protein LOC117515454 [Thalassophryne amazonica]